MQSISFWGNFIFMFTVLKWKFLIEKHVQLVNSNIRRRQFDPLFDQRDRHRYRFRNRIAILDGRIVGSGALNWRRWSMI